MFCNGKLHSIVQAKISFNCTLLLTLWAHHSSHHSKCRVHAAWSHRGGSQRWCLIFIWDISAKQPSPLNFWKLEFCHDDNVLSDYYGSMHGKCLKGIGCFRWPNPIGRVSLITGFNHPPWQNTIWNIKHKGVCLKPCFIYTKEIGKVSSSYFISLAFVSEFRTPCQVFGPWLRWFERRSCEPRATEISRVVILWKRGQEWLNFSHINGHNIKWSSEKAHKLYVIYII